MDSNHAGLPADGFHPWVTIVTPSADALKAAQSIKKNANTIRITGELHLKGFIFFTLLGLLIFFILSNLAHIKQACKFKRLSTGMDIPLSRV
ncbi:MAG: hypothetical protein DRH26_06755 [Deltaproteobacteria bacterium]|nr:MAG: hypothetical protein DRH26_06755 [Deltaproteobacteria bacterium]